MPEDSFETRKTFDPRFVRDERRRSYRLALILFWSVLLYFLFQNFVVSLGFLREQSMLPTMHEGETFLVNKYIYHLRAPQRGEIIVLQTFSETEDQYVKRVVAVPGDTLAIRDGQVWLNGRKLNELYIEGPTLPNRAAIVLEEDTFFVMGDNRPHSIDSRKFGPIRKKDIRGMIRPGILFAFK